MSITYTRTQLHPLHIPIAKARGFQVFGNHRDVVKSILTLKENLEKSTLKRPANFYADQMFMETSYVDEQNRTYTEYLMNRDGFSLLVMGFNNTEKVLEFDVLLMTKVRGF